MLAIANQAPGVLTTYGLTREEVDRAAWTVDAQGRRLEGAAAINRTLTELGGGWRVLAAAYRVKPVAAIEEAAYRWIAPRRSMLHRLGVTPECDEPGAHCA